MKKLYYAFALLTSTHILAAWQVCNLYELVSTSSTRGYKKLVHSAKNSADYVNGGITFTYPGGTFTSAPKVYLTVELKNAVYDSSESYVPNITASDATAATIRVNKVTATTVVEAATDDVTVYISASGCCS